MKLTVQNFFDTVLPSKGVYAIAYKESGGKFVSHKAFATKNDFLAMAQNQDFHPTDYWFALAGFQRMSEDVQTKNGLRHRFSRSQDNAQWLRCLWLDIDVGEDKPYKTTHEALVALRDFCLAVRMDIPTIVYSGSGGLHVYWAFNQDIDKETWRPLAAALHNATVKHGLHADPSRTKDHASILRVPGTFNWKYALPTNVQLQYIAAPRDVAYYKTQLASYGDLSSPTLPHEAGVNNALLKAMSQVDFGALLAGESVEVPQLPAYSERKAEEVVAGCLQLQDQKDAPEPVWRGMLAVLRHCDGGIDMAHKLSKQDARYDEQDTNDKLEQLAEKNIAPYICATFANLRPEVCHKCPHKGTINSPISVPKSEIKVVQVEDDGTVETKVSPELTLDDIGLKAVSTIPVIETDKYRVNDTGCYVYIKVKGSDKAWWEKFYPYPVYPIQKVRDKNVMGEIEISYVFRKHHKSGHDDFQVMGETLMGTGINGFLGSVGFLLNQEERKYMVGFMIDLLKEVGPNLEETNVMDKLGWSKDMKTFLLGNKLYKTNGKVVDITPKGKAADYSNKTVAQGDLAQWTKIANVYNKRGAEWGQMAVASAFASPLMPIGSLERAALLFLTGEKGAGKSTALHLAVSVFADPTEMLINKDDTPLARIAKLGIMSNISVGFDEMTDLSPQEASALAYQITQGRGKDRMLEGGKGVQPNKTFWSCLPVMSANDSIINALSQHSFDATAQMSRVLEVKVTDINQIYTPGEFEQCEMLVRSLPENYGVAGDVYMRWVTANMDTVKEMIYRTEKLFIKRTALDNNYRFYTYMCTRMLVGIMIAKKLGLVDYDIEALLDYMVDTVFKNKNRMVKQNTDVDTVLGSFLSEHIGNRIVVKSDTREADRPFQPELGEVNDAGYVLQRLGQGRELAVRVVRDENVVYIAHKSIKDWCVRTGTPMDKFMTSVSQNAEIIAEKKRDWLGKNTQWHDAGRVSCMVIKLYEDVE